jgi:hypothetical protein
VAGAADVAEFGTGPDGFGQDSGIGEGDFVVLGTMDDEDGSGPE